MMDLTTEKGVKQYLRSKLYPSCHHVERLPEGFGGFVFRAHLDKHEPSSVIFKHVEHHAARSPNWKLDQSRLTYEMRALQLLAQSGMQYDGIRPPRVIQFDEQGWALVLEDAGNVLSLKGWLRPGVDIEQASSHGKVLGGYLANIHNKTADNDQILQQFTNNETAKRLSSTLYFKQLAQVAQSLGYSGGHIRTAAEQGERDVNNAHDVLTLGDFWTGNILVGHDDTLCVLDLELAKPGTAEFDIGQMAAEMYCIAAFRDRKLGMAVFNAFLSGYRETRLRPVDVAKVAIRIGAHLMVIMPNAWAAEASKEQIEEQLRIGDDLLRLGAHRHEKGLLDSMLKPLLN